jgi:hypothetical protein
MLRRLLVAVAYAFFVAVPLLGLGREGEIVTARFDENLLIPAGWAFAIWGLIYAWLLAYTVVQLLPSTYDDPRLDRAAPWAAGAMAACGAWSLVFAQEWFPASLAVMLVALSLTFKAHLALGIGRPAQTAMMGWARRAWGVLAGWLTAATVANASLVLEALGYGGAPLGPVGWAVGVIAVVGGIGLGLSWRLPDPLHGATVAWALFGLAAKHADVGQVAYAAGGFGALVLLGVASAVIGKRRAG